FVSGLPHQFASICTPDALTTSRHFGRSAAMNAAKASGVIGAGSPPTLVSVATTSGASKICFTSAERFSTLARGVADRARRPRRREQALPTRDRETLDGLADGRHLGRAGKARRAGHRQRPHRAG